MFSCCFSPCVCTWTSELCLCLAGVHIFPISIQTVVLQVPFCTSSMQAVSGCVQEFCKPVQNGAFGHLLQMREVLPRHETTAGNVSLS